jgi:hypothetical protein
MTVSYFVSRSRKWTQTKKKESEKKKILNDDDDEITRDEILFCWLLPLSLVSISLLTHGNAHTPESWETGERLKTDADNDAD